MKRLKLTLSQKSSHYMFPALMIAFGLISLPFLFGENVKRLNASTGWLIFLSLFLVAIFSAIKQYKALKLYSIPLSVDKQKLIKATKDIFKNHGWRIDEQKSNFIRATGHGFRQGVDLRSWAEMMTVIVEPNEIKVNSICNPDGFFAQFVSFGKNKQNIRDFERLIKEEK